MSGVHYKITRIYLVDGLNEFAIPKGSSILAAWAGYKDTFNFLGEKDYAMELIVLSAMTTETEESRVHVLIEEMELKHVWGIRYVGMVMSVEGTPRYVFEELNLNTKEVKNETPSV